jgi:hypothetical protein
MYELELHTSWNMLGGIEISKFDLELYETMWEIYPFVSNVCYHFIKTTSVC